MTQDNDPGAATPLTLAQLDFWEEFQAHPGEAVSTVAHALELRGALDMAALAQAIRATIAETDVLALRFQPGPDGLPRQMVDPQRRPALRLLDLSGDADPLGHAMRLMRQDVDAPVDLLRRPIAAQWLVRLGPDHAVWYHRGHHIALDGYAMSLIESRCAQLYAQGHGATPGRALDHFAAYLAEEAAYRDSPRHLADGRHWADILSATPAPQMLDKGSEDYPAHPLTHDEDLSSLREALLAQAARTGIGWPDLLTTLASAWTVLHLGDGSAARQRDHDGRLAMPVWLPYLSRMGSVAINIPALVVNILPFDANLAASEPLGQVLTRLAGRLRKLRRHGRYRIEQIASDHGLSSRQRFFFSPLINVLPFDPAQFQGCACQRHVLSNGPGDGFNITIRADGQARHLELLIEADPALTPADDFARHAASLPAFLRTGLTEAALNRPVGALTALREAA
ncbi:MAG: condensation domain-containing protein [Paracoccus sp. (in: a-proteobacteria)]|uniref:condensation domain-containing protein n=1 Tax=Paracoccus sp. TaxID=267 RepID=UPI0039E68C5F